MEVNNINAEKTVISCMMSNPESIAQCIVGLEQDAFFFESHQRIYGAIVNLFQAGKAIDYITIADNLTKSGLLDEVGGDSYLIELSNYYMSAVGLGSYITIVRDLYNKRRLYATAQLIQRECEENKPVSDVAEHAQQSIYRASEATQSKRIRSVSEIIPDAMAQLNDRITGKGSALTVTGYADLDDMIGGFEKKELIIIGGRPGMGKTSFVLKIVDNISKKGMKIAFFSLEMSDISLVQRLMLLNSRVPVTATQMKTGKISQQQIDELINASGRVNGDNTYIDETAAITINQIHATSRTLKMSTGLDIIVIDYLQLINDGKKSENRRVAIGNISRACKVMAKELDVPVILLSQLTRESDKRSSKEPMLSDLRESGDIEADADVVLFFHREGYYDKERDQSKAKVIVAKQRSGETGTIYLGWNGEKMLAYDSQR